MCRNGEKRIADISHQLSRKRKYSETSEDFKTEKEDGFPLISVIKEEETEIA